MQYYKYVRRNARPFSCPVCESLVLARDYEKHCASCQNLNAKRDCVWCGGKRRWPVRQKKFNASHLLECCKAFLSDTPEKVFPFLRLPHLVQCKIMRQYVGGSFWKIKNVVDVPELSRVLRDRESWLNASETFDQFLNRLVNLRPGLYFSRRNFWDTGFSVQRTHQSVTFRLLSVGCALRRKERGWHESIQPLRNGLEFLKEFEENFFRYRKDNLKILRTDYRQSTLFVDCEHKEIYWPALREVYAWTTPFKLDVSCRERIVLDEDLRVYRGRKNVATYGVERVSMEKYWNSVFRNDPFSFEMKLVEKDEKILLCMRNYFGIPEMIFKCRMFRA